MKQFTAAQTWLSGLDADAVAKLVTASADVAMVVTARDRGVINDLTFGSDELAGELTEAWIGQPWIDTVTAESRPKVEALLRDATAQAPPRWRHINHRTASGADVPVLYTAVSLGEGRVVALGRSLRPFATLQQRLVDVQQAMEQESARVRQVETRHRLLFQVSSEAVLIVDVATRRVVEANPAAVELLGDGSRRVVGRAFPEGFDAAGRLAIDGLLAGVRATGRSDSVTATGEGALGECVVSASLFREDRASFFLVRLRRAGDGALAGTLPRNASRVMEVIESSPDGFVIADLDGHIRLANRAFLDMAQLATEEQVRGEPLDRWLGGSGVDFNLLVGRLRSHGVLRLFQTRLRGEYGSATDVEVCAVAVPEGEEPCLGFTLRDVGPRLLNERRDSKARPRSVEQLTELVGRVPLKDLVRDSTDLIERLCIEAALELTNDNRASAAEVLGLSRQSLYAKLRRYGLGDLDEPAGSESAG